MRIVGIVFGVAALAGVALWIVAFGVFPLVSDAPGLVMDHSPACIERGGYLVNSVMGCRGCHSVRRLDRYSAPPVQGNEFAGGFVFDAALGVPGAVVSSNITPAHLRSWTDGEIFRALTAGVSRDGTPLFPLMRWQAFGTLAEEDILSVIAYLRTLEPVENDPPPSRLDFPANVLVRFLPADGDLEIRAPTPGTVAYGEYLVRASGCSDCHTAHDSRGNAVGAFFAGGREFLAPGLFLSRSANITPHETAGIGAWTREEFIARFRTTGEFGYRAMLVAPGEPNTVMPWWEFSGMRPEDLGAIYDYLRTVPASPNAVVTFEPAPG